MARLWLTRHGSDIMVRSAAARLEAYSTATQPEEHSARLQMQVRISNRPARTRMPGSVAGGAVDNWQPPMPMGS
jgi:hypothetical protein